MFRRINKKNIGFEVSWSTPPATYAILVLLNSLPAVLRAAALQPLQPQTYSVNAEKEMTSLCGTHATIRSL